MSAPTVNEPIKLLLADVDGTLVTQQKALTDRAVAAVRRMHDAGIVFAVTSGRPPRGMSMLVQPLAISTPIAGFNGGLFVNPDLTIIEQHTLPASVPSRVIELLSAAGLDVWLYRGNDWFVLNRTAPHVDREAWTVKFEPTLVQSFDGLLDNVVKIVGVSDDFALVERTEHAAQQEFARQVSATRSQPYYLDVTHLNANKGGVVDWLSRRLNIHADQIATIGDQPNDVLMFDKSGISIAMGNASPQVQQDASFVTATNEDDGFAKAIERYVLGEPS